MLARDPDKLADLLGDVRDEPDGQDEVGGHDDLRAHDATHLMTAAMAPTAMAATRGRLAISLRWALNPLDRLPARAVPGVAPAAQGGAVDGGGRLGPRTATAVGFSARCSRSASTRSRLRVAPSSSRPSASTATSCPASGLSSPTRAPAGSGPPGISALKLSADGQVDNILGLPQHDYANLPGWTLVDVVGFPFAKSEIAPPDYDPVPQGRAAPSLDGVDAALLRLTAASWSSSTRRLPAVGWRRRRGRSPTRGRSSTCSARDRCSTIADCLPPAATTTRPASRR